MEYVQCSALKYYTKFPDDGVEYFVIVYHNVKQAGLHSFARMFLFCVRFFRLLHSACSFGLLHTRVHTLLYMLLQ